MGFKMLKTLIIAAAATVLITGSAWAQSTTYYNAYGQPVGRSQTYGGHTTYYNGYDQPVGTAQTYGGYTTYYNGYSQPVGTARRTR